MDEDGRGVTLVPAIARDFVCIRLLLGPEGSVGPLFAIAGGEDEDAAGLEYAMN